MPPGDHDLRCRVADGARNRERSGVSVRLQRNWAKGVKDHANCGYDLGLRSGRSVGGGVSDGGNRSAGGLGVSYLTGDHVGSSRLITDGSEGVRRRFDYLPFGEELPGGTGARTTAIGYNSGSTVTMPDKQPVKFTGKERDAETGIDYFGARYMSSVHGRFTGPGPYVFQFATASQTKDEEEQDQLRDRYISNPPVWNKYMYGLNIPPKFIDLNGRCSRSFALRQEHEERMSWR